MEEEAKREREIGERAGTPSASADGETSVDVENAELEDASGAGSAPEGDGSGTVADGEPDGGDGSDATEIDWKDRCARALADYENFRKRTMRDREEMTKAAAAAVIRDLLPTVDNLALALGAADEKDPFVKGVRLAYESFVKALADHGATPIDSVGEPLDPNFHEALAQLPSDEVEEGKILTEVKRGWLLHGKLLRAAQVVVSAGKKA